MGTKVYKVALVCNTIGVFIFICSIIVSAARAVINGGLVLDAISFTSLLLLAMLVLDFIALKEHKWRNWSIASAGIKAVALLAYLPQTSYSISGMLENGYRYYYLATILFIPYLVLISFPSAYNIKTLSKGETRDNNSNLDPISIGAMSIGMFLAIVFFIGGINSIGADGWAVLGMLFIAPSLLAIVLLVVDFLALKGRKWFVWSVASLAVKGLCAAPILQSTAYELGQMFRGNSYSGLMFYTVLLAFIVLIAYPSIKNIVNIRKQERH